MFPMWSKHSCKWSPKFQRITAIRSGVLQRGTQFDNSLRKSYCPMVWDFWAALYFLFPSPVNFYDICFNVCSFVIGVHRAVLILRLKHYWHHWAEDSFCLVFGDLAVWEMKDVIKLDYQSQGWNSTLHGIFLQENSGLRWRVLLWTVMLHCVMLSSSLVWIPCYNCVEIYLFIFIYFN